MSWQPKGLIFQASPSDAHTTHATAPFPFLQKDGTLRIYFSRRDRLQKSWPTYLDWNIRKPAPVHPASSQPLLRLGRDGSFDDSGIMVSSVVKSGDRCYLYYVGWNTGSPARYRLAIGLAVSDDGGETFKKWTDGPILDRNDVDPISVSMPWVIKEKGLWRMWYMSFTKWAGPNENLEPFYEIKYAESKDGISWKRPGTVSLPLKSEEEGGLARPSVIRDGKIYRMWYCYRGAEDYRTNKQKSYRIGYAESRDGLTWKRLDSEAGIGLSRDGWDSQMQAYPAVISMHGQKILFYNGNGFGQSGFGWAVWHDAH